MVRSVGLPVCVGTYLGESRTLKRLLTDWDPFPWGDPEEGGHFIPLLWMERHNNTLVSVPSSSQTGLFQDF